MASFQLPNPEHLHLTCDDDDYKEYADERELLLEFKDEVNQIWSEQTQNLQSDCDLTEGEFSSTDITAAINSPELSDVIETALTSLGVEDEDEESKKLKELVDLDVACEHCVVYDKVSSFDKFKAGDHIRVRRYPIPLVNVYDHHAIITKVIKGDPDNKKRGEVTVVHFNKNKDNNNKIEVFTEDIKINLDEHQIDIVCHKTNSIPADQKVQRAIDLAKKYADKTRTDTYHFLFNNCEDVANEIGTGNNASSQRTLAISKAGVFLEKTVNVIRSLLTVAVKFIEKLKFLEKISKAVPAAGILFIAQKILFLAANIKIVWYKKKQGFLCLDCFQKEKTRLVFELTCAIIGLGLTVVILTHGLWIPCAIFSAISVVVGLITYKFYRPINALIHPAANIPKKLVTQGVLIKVGDVITFQYYGLDHEGIVTKTEVELEDLDFMAEVSVVHFTFKGFFEKRTITKESFTFNLKDENVFICDIMKGNINEPNEVVAKAIEKLGSKNWSPFYTSTDFSLECKTGRTDVKKEDRTIRRVTKRDEISPGDVIIFKYLTPKHYAVVVQVKCTEEVKCDVIHYQWPGLFQDRVVAKETFNFKLKEKNLYLHNYSDENVYESEEVVRRAESRLGEKKFNTFTNRSSHLAKWCKIKET